MLWNHFFAEAVVKDHKKCSKCHEVKPISDFYTDKGRPRGDCKPCVSEINKAYSQRAKPWRTRFVDEEKTILYSKAYYKNNKAKYDAYAKEFHKANPSYRRDYYLKLKAKKHEKPCQETTPGM